MYTVVLFCLLTALPHFLYGAGEDALSLTVEHRTNDNSSDKALLKQQSKALCHSKNSTTSECEIEGGNYSPQLILFTAQFISGIGGSLYYTLGVSYMDDNIKKSKTPALFSKPLNAGCFDLCSQICKHFRFLLLHSYARPRDRLWTSFGLSQVVHKSYFNTHH